LFDASPILLGLNNLFFVWVGLPNGEVPFFLPCSPFLFYLIFSFRNRSPFFSAKESVNAWFFLNFHKSMTFFFLFLGNFPTPRDLVKKVDPYTASSPGQGWLIELSIDFVSFGLGISRPLPPL